MKPNTSCGMALLFAASICFAPNQDIQAQTEIPPANRDNARLDHTKVGTVAANALMIEADILTPFNMGGAAIRRGNAVCLIDSKGQIIVPYNTYAGIFPQPNSLNGLFEVGLNAGGRGVINAQGKLLQTATSLQSIEIDPFPGGFAWIQTNTERLVVNGWIVGNYICVNAKGEKAVLKNWLRSGGDQWSEGLLRFKTQDYKYGYIDMTGKVVIPPKYAGAQRFSEGLAAVAVKDQFQQIKWGFIDKRGRTVVPFQYSNVPSIFSQGMAVVAPKVATDIKFSIIDSTGETVANVPASPTDPWKGGEKSSPFGDRDFDPQLNVPYLFIEGMMMMGTESAISILGDDLKQNFIFAMCGKPLGDQARYNRILLGPSYRDYRFTQDFDENNRTVRRMGILDFTHGRYIDAIFENLSVFDPVSNLAYAKLYTGTDTKTGQPTYREGYINRFGIFVIVKKENKNIW